MGVYVVDRYEMAVELQDFLNNLEGEIFKEDFKSAVDDVLKNYDSWSDDDE